MEEMKDQELELTEEQDLPVSEEGKTKAENEVLEAELAAVKDLMLRDRAELENFKRRMNEERIKERKYAQSSILTKLIDLHDNFERALDHEYKDVQALKDGLIAIMNQMNRILEEEQVKKVEALHQPFDPNTQQAVLTESNEEYENDVVLEVLQTGYVYKDRILRPAMVKVNSK